MSEVPDGQVPRDDAFWRTYRAAQAEEAEAWRRVEQRACEHKQLRFSSRHEPMVCADCGADRDEVLAQYRRHGMMVTEDGDGFQVMWP